MWRDGGVEEIQHLVPLFCSTVYVSGFVCVCVFVCVFVCSRIFPLNCVGLGNKGPTVSVTTGVLGNMHPHTHARACRKKKKTNRVGDKCD